MAAEEGRGQKAEGIPRSHALLGNVALEAPASCTALYLAKKLMRLEPLDPHYQAVPGNEEFIFG